MKTYKRFIVLDADGAPCGPCLPTEFECREALLIWYKRTFTDEPSEKKLADLGFRVEPCQVVIGMEQEEDPDPGFDFNLWGDK